MAGLPLEDKQVLDGADEARLGEFDAELLGELPTQRLIATFAELDPAPERSLEADAGDLVAAVRYQDHPRSRSADQRQGHDPRLAFRHAAIMSDRWAASVLIGTTPVF